jgi:hypothetical protein
MNASLCMRLAACVVAAAVLPGSARAQLTPVYPGDPNWLPVNLVGATAAITGTAPRSGNGSLELHLAGGLQDWAYYRTAGDPFATTLGRLTDVNQFSFDWFRTSLGVAGGDAPWLAQTPVVRLLVREDVGSAPRFSELVWERYYTDGSPAPLNSWQQESLFGQNLWRVTLDGANNRSYTRVGCSGGPIDPLFPLLTLPVLGWTGAGGCYDPSNAVVWGLAVGVGSNWPRPYAGFADNLVLGFGDPSSTDVSANFELRPTAVPEPGTVGLTALGLMGIGGLAARRRRRRSGSAQQS